MPANSSPVAGIAHHAQRWRAIAHQADVDGELIIAGSKFTRAVERVDQPVLLGRLSDAARRRFLLGDHRNAWRRITKARDDDRLRGVICLGHRRAVLLADNVEATPANGENGDAGIECQRGGKFDQRIVVHASLIPVARRGGNARRLVGRHP